MAVTVKVNIDMHDDDTFEKIIDEILDSRLYMFVAYLNDIDRLDELIDELKETGYKITKENEDD